MFENLTDLSFQRNWKQATGFYIVYTICALVLFATIGTVFMSLTSPLQVGKTFGESYANGMQAGMEMGQKIGPVFNFTATLILVALIAWSKKNYSGKAIGVSLVAIVISVLGPIFCFIPVAYLTSLPKKS